MLWEGYEKKVIGAIPKIRSSRMTEKNMLLFQKTQGHIFVQTVELSH
jgi:hypothetical protein